MLVNIANAQVSLGHNVYLIIVNDLYDTDLYKRISPLIRVFLIKRKLGSRNILPLIRINFLLWRIKPDVIHCHVGSLIKIVAKPFRKKTCLTRHSVSSQLEVSRQLLSEYQLIFAISNVVKKDLWEKYRVHAIVVDNGISVNEIERRIYRHINKEEIIRIVTVGRILLSVKGQDVIIRAIKMLPEYKIKLDIIGDGPDIETVGDIISRNELQDNVVLLGNKTQEYVFKHLKDYDVFVLASYTEGFGLTVAEAMAAKVPVVVSNIEGPLEIVRGGEYGRTFEVGDDAGCANAIKDVIDNYDSSEKLDAAFRFVKENYSVTRTAKQYVEYYKAI